MVRLETGHIIARYDQGAEPYVLASVKVLELVREQVIEAGFDLRIIIPFSLILHGKSGVLRLRKKDTWRY